MTPKPTRTNSPEASLERSQSDCCGGKRMYPLETSMTEKTGARDTASETLIRVIFPIVTYCGGYSAGAPPLPIPNREVKPGRADGTAPPGGRVGRCRFCKRRLTARDSVSSASSLFIPALCFYPVSRLAQVHLSWFCCISVPGVASAVLPSFCSRCRPEAANLLTPVNATGVGQRVADEPRQRKSACEGLSESVLDVVSVPG